MNRSVNDVQVEGLLNLIPHNRRVPSVKTVVPAMFLYVLFGHILVQNSSSFLLIVIVTAIAYFLTIYLYYGTAALTYLSMSKIMWVCGLAMAAIGLLITNFNLAWNFINVWLMILLAGFITGRLTLAGYGVFKVYLTGVGMIVFFNLVLYLPQWSEMMKMMSGAAVNAVTNFKEVLFASGYNRSAVDEYALQLEKMLAMLTRLIPGSMIMGALVQFSIGFLLFFMRTVEKGVLKDPLPSFYFWRMPFAFIPVVIVTILARLLGGETFQLAADNILLILAVYYCLTGLALSEYFLKKLNISLTMRIVYYILLILSNLYGFFIMALLGFIDSFKDWRKAYMASLG